MASVGRCSLATREFRCCFYAEDYEKVRSELIQGLCSITTPTGKPLGTKVYRPEEVYRIARNVPPRDSILSI